MFVAMLVAFTILEPGALAQPSPPTRSFQLHDIELRAALDSLLKWYAVPLIYLEKDIAGKRVTAECIKCTFEAGLRSVLTGQDLTWRVLGSQVVLERKPMLPGLRATTLAGMVTDSLTGEGLTGASVYLTTNEGSSTVYRWCTANEFGFFSLRNVRAGDYTLVVMAPGYRRYSVPMGVEGDSTPFRQVQLIPQEYLLPEVTVEGQRSVFTAAEGISRGVYIRATPTDHNQYFLEGARIYNPAHFGGVMSSFNGDALRDIHLVAGGVPPYYGGRIGGILDVTLRNGARDGLSGSAAVGSLGSTALIEGPLTEGTSFVLSGRQAYPNIFLGRDIPRGEPSDLTSFETMAKISHRLAGNSRLFLSGYFSRDSYEKSVGGAGRTLFNTLRWGNAAANLRWIGVVSPSLFFQAAAVYTRYAFDVDHRLTGFVQEETVRSDHAIQNVTVRGHAEYFYDEFHTLRGGVELVRHGITGKVGEFSTQLAPLSLSRRPLWELSVYVSDQWRLVPDVSAELGARATSFLGSEGTFSAVDPRFSLLVTLNSGLHLHSSITSVTQFVHPYRNSGIFLFYPTVFFYPSTDQVRPTTSMQLSLGVQKSFEENRYTLAVESYYRVTQKLHEFVFDTTMAGSLTDALITGEGTAYGAEVTLAKRSGDLTGTIRYSLSWHTHRFAELNDGRPFRPRFDRRHEVYAGLSYSPHARWTVGATCLLTANEFPPPGTSGVRGAEQVTFDPFGTQFAGERGLYAEPYDLNGSRLPGFQRLELFVQYRFVSWGLPFHASLRLLNGYGLLDPFVWQLRESNDTRLRWRARLDAPPLFPLYPVVSVGVRF
jgi:hypothetical protein